MSEQIKSRERVRDLAEVYTNKREVDAMLDLIPFKKPEDIIQYRYLEPACGNGNFLIEILKRKLEQVNKKYKDKKLEVYQYYTAKAVSTIYGIDICQENVNESIERLFVEVKNNFSLHRNTEKFSKGFLSLIKYILESNIVVGDSINGKDKITFIEFVSSGSNSFERRFFKFEELFNKNPTPFNTIPTKYYLAIGKENFKNNIETKNIVDQFDLFYEEEK